MSSEQVAARPSPWRTRFAKVTYLSAVPWGAAMLWSVLAPIETTPGWLAIRADPAGLLFLAAALVGGLNFFGAGVRALRTLRLDMNFLMSAAIVAALLIGEPFEAATLAVLFSAAELLERYAVDRARRSVGALLALSPEEAERLNSDGTTATVKAAELQVGETIRVRPGGRVGADGVVRQGTSSINEAAVTGESLPVTKGVGDKVFSGTLNTEGFLDIEVTSDASHSVVARIAELVRAAEGRRAPIERTVQRFARIYTPVVTILAVLVIVVPPLIGLGSQLEWFLRGITLLVIACPCALVIATPVTVVSALTSAARHGVLIKGGEHLEALGTIRAMALDKTGTLTTGQLEVVTFRTTPASAEPILLQLLASVESRSEHPVGKAIVRFAAQRGVLPRADVRHFQSRPGMGVTAEVGGTRLLLGTASLVGVSADMAGSLDPAMSWVFALAPDATLAATIGLQDTLRPDAPRVVEALRGLGVWPVVMLTGDGDAIARSVGRAVGIDTVRSRLLPEDKVRVVQRLRVDHGSVAMVGDGVNDAPALAEATVGIAMGAAGSPAAIETADVALMADDLSRLPEVIGLARRARRTIRYNIGVALGLKLVLVIGTVLGSVNLAVAVIVGDLGGTLVVTLNAMRLARRSTGAAGKARR